jgi:hypothetical protein
MPIFLRQKRRGLNLREAVAGHNYHAHAGPDSLCSRRKLAGRGVLPTKLINIVYVLDGPHSSYPRTWSRSVSNLGSKVDADTIARKLESRWSPSEYPLHIQIVGGIDGGGVSVRVWNSRGIKESEIVYPADYAGSEDPIMGAALEEVECILNRLRSEGKL